MKLIKQEQERWEQYLKETQNILGKPTIGKTDICRDKIKAFINLIEHLII